MMIKTLLRKSLAALIISSMSFGLMAEIALMPSLDWQAQDLEMKINKKLDSVIGSVLKNDQYALNVQLIYTHPAEPDFKNPEDSGNEEESKRKQEEFTKELDALMKKSKDADEKIESQVASIEKEMEARKIEEEIKEKERKKKIEDRLTNKIKYTDVHPDEEKTGDTILFSKFGMEVPLVDDFNDLNPDGKIVLTMTSPEKKDEAEEIRLKTLVDEKEREAQRTERELQRKEREFSLKEAALVNKIRMVETEKNLQSKELSPIEQTWKYNNTVDVFKNLKEVNIKVLLSSGLSEEIKQKVEGYVRETKLNIGKVVPKYTFEYTILGSDLNKPTADEILKDWLGLIGRYATLIGLVLAVLMAGVIGPKLIQKYFELRTGVGNSNTGNFKMEDKEGKDEKDDKDGSLAASGTDVDYNITGLNAIERFKNYLKSAPNDAIQMIKSWINSEERTSKEALVALVQQMGNEELEIIFNKLTSGQKATWRELLNRPLNNQELGRANLFISNQIIQNVIIPSAINDPEVYDLILKLNADRVVELVAKEPKMVGALMNVVSGSFINEVLAKCNERERGKVLHQSMNISAEEISGLQTQMKKVLTKYVKEKQTKPFVDKLLGLISVATPEVESALHQAMGSNLSMEQLRKVGQEQFPAALIPELPVNFLKGILLDYPLDQRVEMLMSLDEESKNFFLNIIAPSGSKAFDMMEIEFSKVANNASDMERIEFEAQKIWFDFVKYARVQIKNDQSYSREISELLGSWIKDIANTKISTLSKDDFEVEEEVEFENDEDAA